MSYATEDFAESLRRTDIAPSDIAAVAAAWGHGSGQGKDAGHYRWSDEDVSDWSGGFLLRMKAGEYIYVTGWCDFTGWGCQDGVNVYQFTERPAIADLKHLCDALADYAAPDEAEWDMQPADLNRWLAAPEAE